MLNATFAQVRLTTMYRTKNLYKSIFVLLRSWALAAVGRSGHAPLDFHTLYRHRRKTRESRGHVSLNIFPGEGH